MDDGLLIRYLPCVLSGKVTGAQSSDLALKRCLDLVAASAGLALFAGPLALVALAIKVDSPGPVFYRGERVGLNGRTFRIFKFRSMRQGPAGGATSTSENDDRVTRVGRYIRRYKLDELSQLINVVAGDMSLVGPRPEVRRFVDMYTDEEKVILTVRPGITDWASIRFHNEGEIIAQSGYADPDEAYMALIRPEKLRLQLKYVRERTVVKDIKIIVDTLAALVSTRVDRASAMSQPALGAAANNGAPRKPDRSAHVASNNNS